MHDLVTTRALLERAHRPVVLTGAGISASSGVSTYRGEGGLWTNDPLAEAHSTPPPARLNDPDQRRAWWDGVWALWGPMRARLAVTDPSPAHRAIARWEEHVDELLVVTQNIDGLHQRAGSTSVVDLHGSLARTRCSNRRCSAASRVDPSPHDVAPVCPHCHRPERPDVVLFTEGLDLRAWDRAAHAVSRADLLVVIGTSGVVTPASHLVTMAPLDCALVRVDPGRWLGPSVTWDSEFVGPADECFAGLWPPR